MRQVDAVSTLYEVRSLALQPLAAGNSAEFSEADNSKTIQQSNGSYIIGFLTDLRFLVPVNRFFLNLYTSKP